MQQSKLPMLAALANHLQAMPASAEAVVTAPRLVTDPREKFALQKAQREARDRANANRTGLNRKARRRLAAQVRHGEIKL